MQAPIFLRYYREAFICREAVPVTFIARSVLWLACGVLFGKQGSQNLRKVTQTVPSGPPFTSLQPLDITMELRIHPHPHHTRESQYEQRRRSVRLSQGY
jgi:hypothetical protein